MKNMILSNKNKILIGALGFVAIVSLPSGSFAAKKAPEVYSAQEEAGSEEIMNDVMPEEATQPAQAIAPKAVAPAARKAAAPVVATAPVAATPAPEASTAPAAVEPTSDMAGRLAALEKEVAAMKALKKSAGITYDAVPANQRGAIIKRIQLAEKLVQDYGRAYDYRTTTLKELEQILNGLQKQQALIEQHTQKTVTN